MPSTAMRSPAATSTRVAGPTLPGAARCGRAVGGQTRDGAARRSASSSRRRGARPAARAADRDSGRSAGRTAGDRGVEIGVLARRGWSRRGSSPRPAGRRARSARPCWCGRRAARRRRSEERPAGVGDRRQRDQRRDPVEQVARRRAHAAGRPAQTETESSMTLPAAKPATASARSSRAGPRAVAGGEHGADRRGGADSRAASTRSTRRSAVRGGAAPIDREPARGQVDARGLRRRAVGRERRARSCRDAAARSAGRRRSDRRVTSAGAGRLAQLDGSIRIGARRPPRAPSGAIERRGSAAALRPRLARPSRQIRCGCGRQTSPPRSRLQADLPRPASGSATSAR